MTDGPGLAQDQAVTRASVAVAVVELDPSVRTRLALDLGEAARATGCSSLEQMHLKLPPNRPVVIVLGPSFAHLEVLGSATHLLRARPEAVSVLVVRELTTEILQAALRCGISEVVALAESPEPLRLAVERVAERVRGPGLAAVSTGSYEVERRDRGRIITVVSTKGGAGRTFVATNLAVSLAGQTGHRVALVDTDFHFGDVAVTLGIAPQSTVIEAVNQIDRLDAGLLESLLLEHEPSGLRVMAAPIEPGAAATVTAAHLRRILDLLSSFCSHIVVDTPATLDEVVLAAVAASDDVVVLAGMDIPHIKDTKIALQTLRLLEVAPKIKLALNRADSKVKIDVADVERTLQLEIDCLIPSDVTVPQSINEGVPVVISHPRSPVARSIQRLAALFPARATS